MVEKPGADRRYHHGDARNALLSAASDLLEGTGAAGLSLRGVAERAGLSRQAPYNHFDDKAALLAELVREGFERLGAAVRAASACDDDVDALAGAGSAYIGFALAVPARFRMMFSCELVDLGRYPDAAAAGADAFAALGDVVARFAARERVSDLAMAAWSIVHGYATLCIEIGVEGGRDVDARAHLFAALIVAGAGHDGGRRPDPGDGAPL